MDATIEIGQVPTYYSLKCNHSAFHTNDLDTLDAQNQPNGILTLLVGFWTSIMFPHINPTKRGELINPVADGSWPRTRVSVEQYNYIYTYN